MPNVQQREQPKDDLQHPKQQDLKHLIREQVMDALGRPDDLLKVQVRKVWDDHYRINVLVGGDAGSIRVAHSYFVVTDSNGGLIATTPQIAKRY